MVRKIRSVHSDKIFITIYQHLVIERKQRVPDFMKCGVCMYIYLVLIT